MSEISKELEAVARAIYEHSSLKSWDVLRSWALEAAPETIEQGMIGATAYKLRGAEDFAEARAEYDEIIAAARSALLTIRDPTEGMLDAALDADDGAIETFHRAMIDYILGAAP